MAAVKPTDLICVGAIAGAFGVRGEARLKSFCAEPRDISKYAPLTTEDGQRSFTVKALKAIKDGFSCRLGGVATREEAEALRGTRLYVPRDRMPSLPDDEFYYSDLTGLDVVDVGGVPVGQVRSVDDFGGGDFLEIVRSDNGRLLLIPFTRAAVPTVDLGAGRIVIDPPEDIEMRE
ncbi:MAG: ribosome maturation factor RimM [Pseudomonadota bacterium]